MLLPFLEVIIIFLNISFLQKSLKKQNKRGYIKNMFIKMSNVSKVFVNKHNRKKTFAVKNINLEIKKGELVSILGPSGCGKSTILYIIAGLISVTEGNIFFDNIDVTKVPPEKRGVGLVFQNYSLYPHMTARQNITFPLQNLKVSSEKIQEELEKISALTSTSDYLDKMPFELSGGQQQRVAIARALIKYSGILLLDEALSNLDTHLRIRMRDEIRKIQIKTNVTAVLVTHDQEEAMYMSDKIYVMNKGTIQQVGTPYEIYNNPVNLFVASFLGVPLISVFHGILNRGNLKIGENVILQDQRFQSFDNKEVYVAIRPEGYELKKDGIFEIEGIALENLGRELVLLAKKNESIHKTFQIIIPTYQQTQLKADQINKQKIRFDIKKNKLFVFDKINENRIF
ncbi:MAG: ABC transporter ATP-binding protein [Candidatus Phytoplasma australasiaticum]|nr:ABC transporter ATP-binding protein [Candidatus Phytoplasma australasiaticum]MDV3181054.1 ABC transporter ATP-binding protein [Candidatus Phytoplasma australasiaticum]MDV3185749.1 ABC transporter ATP-binding protein [Candidatus Phytoplasma australasiaticum]MDV3192244.1 ABC transporter ATP-binding protein [Candidatus Phytoplasma australasiaticum]